MQQPKKMFLIVNFQAGQKRIAKKLADIVSIFCEHGFLPTVVNTQYTGHARELVEAFAKDYDIIVCAGGDGTLNETVSGLLTSGVERPVGYLPCGTTNDLATTLGLSRDLLQAAHDIVEGEAIPLDLGIFNGRYFVYTASFGAFTRASYETSQLSKNVLGHLAYLLEGVKDLPNLQPVFARIKTDQEELSGDFVFGAISNTTSLAGILTLDKEKVRLDDGKFEILLIDMPKNAIDLSQTLVNIAQKKFEGPIHLITASTIDIETNEPLDWTLDGEFEKGDRNFHVQNLHSAVRFVICDHSELPISESYEINTEEEDA